MGAAHRYFEIPAPPQPDPLRSPRTRALGLISDGPVPHAPTGSQETIFVAGTPHRAMFSGSIGSAGDDVSRGYSPTRDIPGIARENDGVAVEGDDRDVSVDHVARAWCRRGQHADAAACLRIERKLGHDMARGQTPDTPLRA